MENALGSPLLIPSQKISSFHSLFFERVQVQGLLYLNLNRLLAIIGTKFTPIIIIMIYYIYIILYINIIM
jgi:hypothetical protein